MAEKDETIKYRELYVLSKEVLSEVKSPYFCKLASPM